MLPESRTHSSGSPGYGVCGGHYGKGELTQRHGASARILDTAAAEAWKGANLREIPVFRALYNLVHKIIIHEY